nr:immunoglobulin light chain junction region [Macaca mulatta]MOV34445.1 immunoglobulin light chain junction region [Macaca mulatta]MOX09156.1 immunoglobulin light chain junction region [Macaca mulatta]
CQKYSRSPFTF